MNTTQSTFNKGSVKCKVNDCCFSSWHTFRNPDPPGKWASQVNPSSESPGHPSRNTGVWQSRQVVLRSKAREIATLAFYPIYQKRFFFSRVKMHLFAFSLSSLGTYQRRSPAAEPHLRWLFWNRFILQGLKGFHCSVVPRSLSSLSFPKKFIIPYGQLNIKDLRHWAMIPKVRKY